MVYDEDTLLLSFFDRYQLPDDEEDLKKDVLKYIGGGLEQKPMVEEQQTDDVNGMSSPLDSAFDMKKRRRLA